jgi:hypothetical protein
MLVFLGRCFHEETACLNEFYSPALIRSSNNPDVLNERIGIELFFQSEVSWHLAVRELLSPEKKPA